MAQILTEATGRPISASGIRAAARRGDVPYSQAAPGSAMRFDPAAVLESDYQPNLPRGEAQPVRCANPKCKNEVEVSAYARRNYRRHFCSWECKYAAAGAWNPGGGRRGPHSTDWRPAFLAALSAGCTVAAAANAAGVAKATPYRQRATDDTFREAWAAAVAQGGGGARAYWSDPVRSGPHRAKLGRNAYREKIRRGAIPALERGLRSPAISERREEGLVERRRARREEIVRELLLEPRRSNRSIARELHRDPALVGILRRQLEESGELDVRTWGGRRSIGRSRYPHARLSEARVARARSEATSRATKASTTLYRRRADQKRERFLDLLETGSTLDAARKAVGWSDRRYAQRVARAAGHAPGRPGRPRKAG